MRLSRRSKYGLLALVELASCEEGRCLPTGEVAQRISAPAKSLEDIFALLRSAAIVQSQRGARGGYRLRLPADQITVGEVIRRLDGTVAPVSCVSRIAYEPCTCPQGLECPVRWVMGRVRDAIAAVIDATTIQDLADRAAAAPSGDVLSSLELVADAADPVRAN
jgi:Rrf2 family transcriptional regulator, cysteine metabolism repressor